jgi:hypothetical protein
MNPKSTLVALPEPWYTLVNISSELPVGEWGDEPEFPSPDWLRMFLLLSELLLKETGTEPSNRCYDIHFHYVIH